MRRGMILGFAFIVAIGFGCGGDKFPSKEGQASTGPAGKPAETAHVSQPTSTRAETPTATEAEARERAKDIVNETTRYLMGVMTVESAQAAVTPLTRLADRLETTMTELKKHGSTAGSGDVTRALHRVVEDVRDLVRGPLRTAIDKMRTEIRRISAKAELEEPLANVIGKIDKAVQM